MVFICSYLLVKTQFQSALLVASFSCLLFTSLLLQEPVYIILKCRIRASSNSLESEFEKRKDD